MLGYLTQNNNLYYEQDCLPKDKLYDYVTGPRARVPEDAATSCPW